MTKSILEKRWVWLAAAALVVISVVAWQVLHMPEDAASEQRIARPASEIPNLAARGDLNVLFIVIDTLRSDRLGSYGYLRNTSPTLDALAAGGIRFGNHLSQSSWTKASMASMWTGLYPTRTGVTRYDHMIPEDAAMPAEILRDAGFRTIGIYRNGWIAPTFGFQQGFDVYSKPAHQRLLKEVKAANPTLSGVGTDEDTIAGAIEFLRVSRNDQRWFLYLHLMDVHEYVYDAESAIFGSDSSDKYDSSIRWTDGTLNALFAWLAHWELFDDTIIVIASDHGEAFRERGLEGHARAVYPETTTVPWIISLPFRLDPGIVVTSRTENVDIWPTLFELLGIDLPSEHDGESRMPEIMAAAEGKALPESDAPGFSHLDKNWGRRDMEARAFLAVLEGSLRYQRSDGASEEDPPLEELFDASLDPSQLENRLEAEPERAEELRARAAEYMALDPPWGEAPKREIEEMELNQLRALGYSIP
jgi:arylsulfatase A-like enzyme